MLLLIHEVQKGCNGIVFSVIPYLSKNSPDQRGLNN